VCGVGGPTAPYSRRVGCGRFSFMLSLVCAATGLGALSYHMAKSSEVDLATRQFESLADRALTEAVGSFHRKRLSLLTMASVVSQLQPNASDYPFVAFPHFEEMATDLLRATGGESDMGYIPFVDAKVRAEWEEFAYDYYFKQRDPPFTGNKTATGVSPFGRGIWAYNDSNPYSDEARYHDVNGTIPYENTPFPSLLTPVFQLAEGENMALMNNMHSRASRAITVDGMLECVEQYKAAGKTFAKSPGICGSISGFLKSLKYRDQRGPSSILYQPLFPKNNPDECVGFIGSSVLFDEILEFSFPDVVSGVECVISNDNLAFAYMIEDGMPVPVGFTDRFSNTTDSNKVCRRLTDQQGMYGGINSMDYTLCLYSTDEFVAVYSTNNPVSATIGSVLIIFFTSVVFFVYDAIVRREFCNKKELLEAKRQFMRFVSHEVSRAFCDFAS